MTSPTGRDRGATDALGLVLIAPAMIGLAVLVLALGGRVDDRARLRSAASAAAQAAALERNPADARRAAVAAIEAMAEEDDGCGAPTVDYPTARAADVGTAFGVVTVSMTCRLAGSSRVGVSAESERFSAAATVDLFRTGP